MYFRIIIFFLFFLQTGSASAQQNDTVQWLLKPVEKFLKLSADNNFGEVSGVAQNSKGHTGH